MKQSGSAGDADAALGKLAVELGLITQLQLRQTMASGGHGRMSLGACLLMDGILDDTGLRRLMDEHARRAGAAPGPSADGFFTVVPRAEGNEEPTLLSMDMESVRTAAAGLSTRIPVAAEDSGRATMPSPPMPGRPTRGEERPAPAAMLPPPPGQSVGVPRLIDGRFEIMDQLGRGGMGIVYRARDKTDGKIVALKLLVNKEQVEAARLRFKREWRLIEKLTSENIVRIWHAGEWEGTLYYAMEYVEGQSLGDLIETAMAADQPMELRDCARIARDVAFALHEAHLEGIVHRDIKPDNILITVEGVPKIADFGLSKHVTSQTQLTMAGNALGTPIYMPPEQATGQIEEIDARSDIYSLGASLYEAVTNEAPVRGDDPFKIMENVVNRPLVKPSKFRPDLGDLEKVILKAMEKNKKNRYPDASAFAEDLDRWLADEPVLAGGAAVSASGDSRRLLLWVAATVVIAALIGAAFALMGKAHGDPPGPEAKKALELAQQSRAALSDAEIDRLLGKRDGMTAYLKKARELADQALAFDPTRADAAAVAGISRRRLAVLSGSHQEHVDAGTALDRAVGANPGDPEVKLERGLAFAFLYWRLARPAWPILSDANVPFPAIPPRIEGGVDEMERCRKLAAADLEEIAKGGDTDLAAAATAFLAAMGKDPAAARDAAEKALAGRGYRPELLRVRGRARLDLGGEDPARDSVIDFNAYLNLSPGEASVHAERGVALYRSAKHAEAVADFLQAEKLGAPAADMAWNRACCHIAAGDEVQALADLGTASLAGSPDPHRWMSRALLHGRMERWNDALADMTNAARTAPGNEDVALGRGELQEAMARPKEALATYNALIQLATGSRRGYLARASLRETLNALAAGIEDYTKALELGPNDSAVLLERARYHALRGDLEKSNADLDQAMKFDPKNPAPLIARGRNAARLKKYADAVADFDRALALDPSSADALVGKGDALLAQGNVEKAFEAYADAVRNRPEEVGPHMTRAQAALEQVKALKAAPDQAKRYLAIALADLKEVAKLDPEGDDGVKAKKLLAKYDKEK